MDDLPRFPDFVPIDIGHKDILRAVAAQFPPYSDFNFASLFTWGGDGDIAVASLNGNVVVEFSDYNDGAIFFSLLGINEIPQTLDTIFRYCKQFNLTPELKLIGEAVIGALPEPARDRYSITEDRDNHDYILSAVNMSDLAKFHPKKRTKYNRFVREHGDRAVCRELDVSAAAIQAEIKQLLEDWQTGRGHDDEDIRREFAAIRRCLEHAKTLNISGYGTYVGGQLVAFTLFELVHNKTAMLHFGKTDTTLKGANEHLQHNLAKYLRSLDVELMNNEQDMGIEGLRQSKQASLPVDYLRKYIIRPK